MTSTILKITFVYFDTKKEVMANIGETVLQVARRHGIPLEGACEGSLACSTCHVVVDDEHFICCKSAQEEDLLDLAFGLQKTSRLGCQVVLDKNMDGATFYIPDSRNFYG